MTVLLATHPAYAAHDTGPEHPERAARLDAVRRGIRDTGLEESLATFQARQASRAELCRVHVGDYVDALERFCAAGGGQLDPDTTVVAASYDAALRAAGAGLEAIERLRAGEGEAAFCAVRPPGHHATPSRGMGFCLFNNVAVAAAALAESGERVLIVDFDAHHGNGTQDAFYRDPRVLFVSFHQYPLYPGTGALREVGTGDGAGSTVNFPLPAGSTGDVYRAGIDRVVAPLAERFGPTWVLISAGFDGHRDDPITDLGLAAGDYSDVTAAAMAFAPPGRRLAFLEGGYDLRAVVNSTAATVASLAGVAVRPEPATAGGPGMEVVDAAVALHLGPDAPLSGSSERR